MNPLRLALAQLAASPWRALALALLIGLSVAIGVGIAAQERAIRTGSARAADAFDLVIGAPGSPAQLVLSTVYLQEGALSLMPGETLQALAQQPGVAWAAPVAFGDTWRGRPIVGTSLDLVTHGGQRAPAQGRLFAAHEEAVAGAYAGLALGAEVTPSHGASHAGDTGEDAHRHEGVAYKVVGVLAPTGTPWDRAILVPVEAVWEVHSLPNGHRGDAEDAVGPPWDGSPMPGVPAIVVKPRSVADAYRLRAQFRSSTTQALFPAEVLVELYGVMADVGTAMAAVVVAMQGLVLIAVLVAATAMIATRARQIGALAALGAPAGFIFLALWIEIALVLVAGLALGAALGYGASWLVSRIVAHHFAVALPVTLALGDAVLPAAAVVAGLALAAIPALLAATRPAARALKQDGG